MIKTLALVAAAAITGAVATVFAVAMTLDRAGILDDTIKALDAA